MFQIANELIFKNANQVVLTRVIVNQIKENTYEKMKWAKVKQPDQNLVNQLIYSSGISEKIAIMTLQKGFDSVQEAERFLIPQIDHLNDPYLLKGMKKAVQRIVLAAKNHQKVVIYGDFDVDGITSVSMLYMALKDYFKTIAYYIPDRKTEGYGLSKKGIDRFIDEKFDLLITVDCGISNYDLIQYANKNHIDVIVCDHHLPPEKLPPALAILNPKQKDCIYPCKELCGCGVAYKLLTALGLEFNIPTNKIYSYLDLVALATTCDMVPLLDENRVICHFGLRCINKKMRLGLLPFKEVIKNKKVDSVDLGFKMGPRLNAAGRVSHSHKAVELLISQQLVHAHERFQEIEQFNQRRKRVGRRCFSEAKKKLLKKFHQIDDNRMSLSADNFFQNPKHTTLYQKIYSDKYWSVGGQYRIKSQSPLKFKAPLTQSITQSLDQSWRFKKLGIKPFGAKKTTFVYHPNWERGVFGITANEMVNKWAYQPTVILSDSNSKVSGSARSTESINIHQVLSRCSPYLDSYGGHKAAAGMTLRKENLEQFEIAFENAVCDQYSDPIVEKVKYFAIDLEFGEIDLEFYHQLQKLAPFGMENQEPIFRTKNCRDTGNSKVVGNKKNHLQVDLIDASRNRIKGIGFHLSSKKRYLDGPVSIYYTLGINMFWGNPEIQIKLIDIQSQRDEIETKI